MESRAKRAKKKKEHQRLRHKKTQVRGRQGARAGCAPHPSGSASASKSNRLKRWSKITVNNVDKSSGHHDKSTRTQSNTQNSTKHAEQQDVTDTQNKLCLLFLFFPFLLIFYIYLNNFVLVRSMTCIWGLNQF